MSSTMSSETSDMFCEEHSNSITPISVLTTIMAKKNKKRFQKISKEFARLKFTKIQDLAQSTLEEVSSMNFSANPLFELYNALEEYDAQLGELWKSASIESDSGNFIRTQEICHEILLQRPGELKVLVLIADACFQLEEYDKSIKYLLKAKQISPMSGIVLNTLGSNYWKKCQYNKATDYFLASVTIRPEYTKGWLNYAKALVETNDMEGAKFAYQKVLTLEPGLNSIRKKYGNVLLALGEISHAQRQFETALKHAPNDTDILNSLGNIYSLCGKLDTCISFYIRALKIDKNLEETWCNLGVAYGKLKNYKFAVSAFRTGTELYPKNTIILKNLATLLIHDDNIIVALEIYKNYLKLEPDNLDINFELALLHIFKLINFHDAEPYLKKCVELHSQSEYVYKLLVDVYKNLNKTKKASDTCIALGDLYLNGNRLKQAKFSYEYALYFNPENPISEWKVGLTLFKLEDIDSALSRFKKAIDLDPKFANAYFNSALVYEKLDDSNKAIEFYTKALELKPTDLKCLHNMSSLKRKLGLFNEAVDFTNKILECDDSDHFNVHMDLANMLYKEMKNPDYAIIHYEKALTYNKSCLKIYISMGNILAELKRSKEAINCFDKAIELDPLCIPAYIRLSSVYKNCGNFIEAINSYDKALQQESKFKYDIYCDLVFCLQIICNWSDYDNDIDKLIEVLRDQLLDNDQVVSLSPQDCLLLPLSIELQKQVAANYFKRFVEKLKNLTEEPEQFVYQTRNSSSNDRLKIGIVSSCFNKEPISSILQSMYNYLSVSEQEIEIFCYVSSNDNIPFWMNTLKGFNHLRDLSKLKVYDAAKAIIKDGIHILVDLNTNGVQTEIFAFRPAPVQVSWVGCYPCTIGSSFIDYLITDKICSPPEYYYTEKLVYVNETVFVGNHKHTSMNLRRNYTRQQYNLPEGVVVFCNFSQPIKLDPNTFRMWIDILSQVPDSVLWLLRWNNDSEKNINKFAEQLNFDTSRIIFSDIVPRNQHLRRIHLADIYLDTLIYNGNMDCLDAIWSGVPVITLPGKTYASRITASQLTALGYIKTIAKSNEQYIRYAIQCGLDSEMLKNIRIIINKKKMESNLFNANSYASEITEIFKKLWSEHVKYSKIRTTVKNQS